MSVNSQFFLECQILQNKSNAQAIKKSQENNPQFRKLRMQKFNK